MLKNPNYILSEEWQMPDNLIDTGDAIDFYLENTKVDRRKKEYTIFKDRINEMIDFYNKIVTKKYGFKRIS